MLKTLTCDKFKLDPRTNKPYVIHFESGLNIVRGTASNTNSIGKSTLLLLVDFALGGTDYENHCNLAVNQIGHHTIYFELEHNGKHLIASRGTEQPDKIKLYSDATFSNPLTTISLPEYLSKLQTFYSLEDDFTFRQMIGPYIRVYQRQTTNEKTPLNSASSQPVNDAILNHLKLHGVYNDLNDLIQEREELDDKVKTYKKSAEYRYIRKINKEEYEKNLKLIDETKSKIANMLQKYNDKKYDNQISKNSESSSIASTLASFEQQRDNLEARYNAIESLNNINISKFDSSLSELKEFFPNEDFRSLEETQKFHTEMVSIFNSQTQKEKKKLKKDIDALSEIIKQYEEKYKQLNHIETLPETMFREHASLSAEIERMEDENKKYLDNVQNDMALKNKRIEIEEKSKDILRNLQDKINNGLKVLNSHFYNGSISCPKITFNGIDRKYTFYTPSDEGTGTSQKGVILFDLYTLSSTILPLIVHDTIILKHIEDYTIQEILKLYNGFANKQIIVSYDGDKQIDSEAQHIIVSKTRITLGPNSEALFGKEFNK